MSNSSKEIAQNGVRREAVADPSGSARRTLCAFEEIAQNGARRALCVSKEVVQSGPMCGSFDTRLREAQVL
jgi:hypothetical protein